jgi:copper chaperone
MKISMRVEGMHCGACVRRLSKAIANVGGASEVNVQIGLVEFKALDSNTQSAVKEAVERAGFEVPEGRVS